MGLVTRGQDNDWLLTNPPYLASKFSQCWLCKWFVLAGPFTRGPGKNQLRSQNVKQKTSIVGSTSILVNRACDWRMTPPPHADRINSSWLVGYLVLILNNACSSWSFGRIVSPAVRLVRWHLGILGRGHVENAHAVEKRPFRPRSGARRTWQSHENRRG